MDRWILFKLRGFKMSNKDPHGMWHNYDLIFLLVFALVV